MKIGRVELENEVKSGFHLFGKETVEICLEFVLLRLIEPRRGHCLVILVNCNA